MRAISRIEGTSRILWTGLLVSAAVAHWLMPEWFIAYYPSYLPLADAAIAASAIVELMIAFALWHPRLRRSAWISLSILMLIYLPVHIYVITHHDTIVHPSITIPLWLAWLRLPVQFVFIAWPALMAKGAKKGTGY